MLSLYEITQNMKVLENYLDEEDFDEEMYQNTLDLVKIELNNKSTSLIHVIKNIESDETMLDNEIKRLKAIKDRKSKNLESLKEYIKVCMEQMNLTKIETPIGNFSLRKSESVNIIDSTKIPSEYVNVVIENKPDKVKIKEALKNKIVIEGAEIVNKNNLNIK
jgi:hypothetical protein